MKKNFLTILVLVSLFFFLFAINMMLELAENLSSLFNVDQAMVNIIFLVLFLGIVLLPLLSIIRLPQRLKGEETRKKTVKRLQKNKILKGHVIESPEQAYNLLNIEADKLIEQESKRVFHLTAISQNGALDIISVLFYQLKMILGVSRIYLQRPSVRELTYLYSNVGTSVFLTGQIEESEYLESVEPILSNILGSTITLVPGTSLVVNSIISGTSNAYLTLRVGLLTKKYCQYVNSLEKKELRKSVSVQAGSMLIKISKEGTVQILNKLGSSLGSKVGGSVSDVSNRVKEAFTFNRNKKESQNDTP